MRAVLLAGAVLMAASGRSAAQPDLSRILEKQLGTISVKMQPEFTGDGKLYGCSLVYTALARDWTYRRGAFIKVDGSVSVMKAAANSLAGTLKVVLNDVDPQTMRFTPSRPADAFLIGSDFKTTATGSMPSDSDTPGAIFIVIPLQTIFPPLIEGLASDKLTVAFTRKKGGAAIKLELDLSVEDIRPDGTRKFTQQNSTAFAACAKKLAE